VLQLMNEDEVKLCFYDVVLFFMSGMIARAF
jgi:hypothetical protein